MRRQHSPGRLLAVGLGAVLLVGLVVSWAVAQTSTPIAPLPAVRSRATTIGGQPVGEILIGEQVVLRLREPAGGYTPSQRADIVAARLASLMSQGYTWQDINVGRQGGEAVLLLGTNLLVTVDERHAAVNRTTPTALAYTWAGQMQTALSGSPVTLVAGTQESWPDWTNADTKIVPIVSIGTPGLRLGFAQVSGPRERVNTVNAVLQLDLTYERAARVFVFVPSTSLTQLDRVQGTAVSALLQYQLVRF